MVDKLRISLQDVDGARENGDHAGGAREALNESDGMVANSITRVRRQDNVERLHLVIVAGHHDIIEDNTHVAHRGEVLVTAEQPTRQVFGSV